MIRCYGQGEMKIRQRQIEVIYYASIGLSRKETAQKLFVTDSTIQAHRIRICDLLDASKITHAVAIALRQGIIE